MSGSVWSSIDVEVVAKVAAADAERAADFFGWADFVGQLICVASGAALLFTAFPLLAGTPVSENWLPVVSLSLSASVLATVLLEQGDFARRSRSKAAALHRIARDARSAREGDIPALIVEMDKIRAA